MKKSNTSNIGRSLIACHMCAAHNFLQVLDLGFQPHSDFFPSKDELVCFEPTFPLRLVQCQACGLLQIDYYVNKEYLYQGAYLYQSSTTETGRTHFHDMATEVVRRIDCVRGELVVDIGSNVGVLLGGFKQAGMRVLGVDPAEISREAEKIGIPTIIDFFGSKTAQKILQKHGHAKIITGTNVFAHIHELQDAVNGMVNLLDKSGAIVIEAPHALELIKKLEYDTIYHQHISYLSVRPLQQFFARVGMELFDVKKQSIHGGTLRYYIGHKGVHKVTDAVAHMLTAEETFGLYSIDVMKKFAKNVVRQKIDLVSMILNLKKQGKTIVALSTPAKGNTLLNYCHLDNDYITFATERNPLKIGRYTPGTHIPIFPDSELKVRKPDYALLLAWNFSKEIIKNLDSYRKIGGKFIIPIPKPKII